MLVVLPVCEKDMAAALRNLKWCRELDQSCNFACLISAESGQDTGELEAVARTYFGGVQVLRYPPYPKNRNPKWPRPQNWAWRAAALHLTKAYREPWLWWEQDAVPIKAGWLEALNAAYMQGGKPFLGTYGARAHPAQQNHLNGVAIYPPDWQRWCPQSMFASDALPFDVCGGWRVLNNATLSPLIQHSWSWENDPSGPPCTFPDTSWLRYIGKQTALFHRCKDDSLINCLRGSTAPTVKEEQKQSKAYVMLGRAGDITNALPILESESEKSSVPVNLVSAQEFQPLLDGVSYVNGHFLEVGAGRLKVGLHFARRNFAEVTSLQVYGDDKVQSKETPNYNKDAWSLAGYLDQFDDRSLRPRFDIRSPKREAELLEKYIPKGSEKPVCCLAIAGGYSSPFRMKPRFRKLVYQELSKDFEFIDLNEIQFERFYDALVLLEACDLLISADSAHLHLAAAVDTPVIALLSDRSAWAQTAPRCNAILALEYGLTIRQFERIAQAARTVTTRKSWQSGPRLIHAVDNYWRTKPNEMRHQLAFRSWQALYKGGRWLAGVKTDPIRTTAILSSHTQAPFLKDILRAGLDRARPEDVIVWTNSDTIIQANLTRELDKALAQTPVVVSRRMDYRTRRPHPGRDLAAFQASWLEEHWQEIPDFALGHPEFDVYLALLARKVAGRQSTAKQLTSDLHPADLPTGTIQHLDHGVPEWDKKPIRHTSTGNVYNLRLLREWCQENMLSVRFTGEGRVDWNL